MTNKLVVIINSLEVPKIKKFLVYEIKFLVQNYSCFQNPWLGSYCPQIPVLIALCPQLNLLNLPKQNSWLRHCSHLTWKIKYVCCKLFDLSGQVDCSARSINCDKRVLCLRQLSICQHGKTLVLLDGNLWNLVSILRKFVKKIHASLASNKNNGYSSWKPMHIYDNISLSSC